MALTSHCITLHDWQAATPHNTVLNVSHLSESICLYLTEPVKTTLQIMTINLFCLNDCWMFFELVVLHPLLQRFFASMLRDNYTGEVMQMLITAYVCC